MNEREPQSTPCPLCAGEQAEHLGSRDGYTVVRCSDCGLGFLQPMPGADEIAAIYDDYDATEMYLGKYRKKVLSASYKQKLAGRFLKSGKGRFLDIGCNVGAVCETARQSAGDCKGYLSFAV